MSNKPLIISVALNVLLTAGISGILYLDYTDKSLDLFGDKKTVVEKEKDTPKTDDKGKNTKEKVDLSSLEFKNEKDVTKIQDGLIFAYDKNSSDLTKKELIELANDKKLKITLLNLNDSKDKKIIEDYINKNQKDIKVINQIREYEYKLYDFQTPEFLETKKQLEEVNQKLNTSTDDVDVLTKQQEVLVSKLNQLQVEISKQVFDNMNNNISKLANERASRSAEGEVFIEDILNDEKIKNETIADLKKIEQLVPLSAEELYTLIGLNLQRPASVIFKEMPKEGTLYFVYNHKSIEEQQEENKDIIFKHQLISETKEFNIKKNPSGEPAEESQDSEN